MPTPEERRYPDLGALPATVGRAFQGMLDEARVSQRQVAQRIGRNNAYVVERVSGFRPFSIDLIVGLAMATGADPEELLAELVRRVESE